MAGRILVVQLARLGDMVQTWPLLRRLGCRGAEPALLADQNLSTLHPLGPKVSQVWHLNLGGLATLAGADLPAAYRRLEELVRRLRSEAYEVIYNLNFSRVSLLLCSLVGKEVRGYRPLAGGREFLRDPLLSLVYALVHSRQVNRLHLSDVFRHLAPQASTEPEPPRPREPARDLIVGLQLATRHPRRTWPLAAFIRLTEWLIARLGAWIWLLGSKAERSLGESLTAALPPSFRERVLNLQGRTSLPELAECLCQVQILVSGDTGTLHLAAAMGTKTVGLFLGPASCHETGPYGVGHYVLEVNLPCHPCSEAWEGCEGGPCSTLITPDTVAALVANLVSSGGPGLLEESLPPEVTLYHSLRDEFGIHYLPVSRPLGFFGLVGLAYRRAAARLAGVKPGSLGLSFGELAGNTRDCLELFLQSWQNGSGRRALASEIAAAMLPLEAFRRELRQQQNKGRQAWETAAYYEVVARELRGFLENLPGRGERENLALAYSAGIS